MRVAFTSLSSLLACVAGVLQSAKIRYIVGLHTDATTNKAARGCGCSTSVPVMGVAQIGLNWLHVRYNDLHTCD